MVNTLSARALAGAPHRARQVKQNDALLEDTDL